MVGLGGCVPQNPICIGGLASKINSNAIKRGAKSNAASWSARGVYLPVMQPQDLCVASRAANHHLSSHKSAVLLTKSRVLARLDIEFT